MVEMVNARRNAETKEERYDLFSGLLDASDDDLDGATAITEKELIGKCYLMHLAHEKRSHSQCQGIHLSSLSPDMR
jgi:hypothetical protein